MNQRNKTMYPLRFLTLAALACSSMYGQGKMGSVKTEIEPGRAGVFIDGKYVGPAANFKVARTYPVTPGEHEIKLVDPRYEEITKKVTVAAGKKTIIKETMKPVPLAKPPFGFLRTQNADHFAAVYINDKYYGHVDEFSNFAQKLLLPPGEYEVKIVPLSGTNPVTQKVKIEAEKTTIVK